MAQENEHVKKLIAARERMIQDRRNLADALANEYKGGRTERRSGTLFGSMPTFSCSAVRSTFNALSDSPPSIPRVLRRRYS